MAAEEVAVFGKNPYLKEILQIRVWDDAGKDPGRAAPPFAHFRPLLQRVVRAHAACQA